MQDFAETYRAYSDDEVARLYPDVDSLTEAAREALISEIERRGLREEEIHRIQAEQAKHVADVDKEEKRETKDRLFKGLMSIFGGLPGRAAANSVVESRKRMDQRSSRPKGDNEK